MIAVVRVLTDDELVYQWHEFHLLLEQALQLVVVVLVVTRKVDKVPVGCYEQDVTHLVL